MYKKISGLILLSLLSVSGTASAHGEDTPGPNGGEIRMPGIFHVELKQLAANKLGVFLLDINFKNPVIKSSSAGINLKKKIGKTVTLDCVPKLTKFECTIPSQEKLEAGDVLLVNSTRNNEKGAEVAYNIPLKFK